MKLTSAFLLVSGVVLAACSGASVGDVFEDGGDGGSGGASATGTGGNNTAGPSGSTSATGTAGTTTGTDAGPTTGPGGTSVSSTGPGGPSSSTSGPGGGSSVSTGGNPVCGDGTCNGSETCATCPDDCEQCTTCGDLICDAGESATCPQDCNPQSVSSSSTGGMGQCPPEPCQAGGEVDATCTDTCVTFVCSFDATCCDGTWSQACADYAVMFQDFGVCIC